MSRSPAMTGTDTTCPSRARTPAPKSWDYAALGLLVAVLMVLIATGVVPIFDI